MANKIIHELDELEKYIKALDIVSDLLLDNRSDVVPAYRLPGLLNIIIEGMETQIKHILTKISTQETGRAAI